MKILVIGSVYPRSPQDTEVPWLRTSVDRLMQAGCTVRVLAPSYRGLSSHSIDNVPVHRFRYAPSSLEILTHDEGAPSKMAARPWMQLLAIPYILSGFLYCLWLALRFRPHIIHAHWPFPHALIALGASKLLRIPLVLNFHGAELLLVRKHPWVRHVLHFVIGRASLIFANSSFTAARIQEIRPCPVEISPYGTTLGISAQARIADAAEPLRVLFVGRHIERKGISVLLHAAELLSPAEFEIRIVGHGNCTASLQQTAHEKELPHVHFTGKLNQTALEKEYTNAHVFVLPAIVDSRGDTEGLGVVLIEAAEYGLPLIASDVGGIPDVVVDNVSGLLLPPGNPQALAAALQRLRTEPDLARHLVEGSRTHIEKHFSWPGIIERQISAYKKLLI